MSTYKIKPLVAAIALATPVLAQSAMAQDGEQATLEEITVTASYRDSLANALNQKRDAVGSRDVIMAEDIADFPDLNLAESLQRIPGVAISRDAGEGRNVSVRGLGPEFTRVRINGMESMSTTGGTDSSGGANRSRSFDFNTFASELFNSLTVHKTASADLDEGSLGATIDLSTGRPLDYKEDLTFRLSGQAGYNDLAQELDPRASFLLAGKNEDGNLGWSVTGSYSKRNILEEGFSAVRWSSERNFASCSACADQAEFDAVNDGVYPRIPRYGILTHDQERLGFTGSIQFQPTDRTDISVDYLLSDFDATRSEEFVEVSIKENGNANQMDVVDYALDANNTLTYMALSDFDTRIENRYDELNTRFQQLSVSASHEFTDSLRVDGLIGTSSSEFDNPIQTTIIYDAFDAQETFSYDARSNSEMIPLSWGGFDLTDANNFDYTNFRDRPNSVDNGFDTAQFNLTYDLNDIWSVKAGVSYKQFSFEVTESRRDNQVSDVTTDGQPLPVGNMYSLVSLNGITWVSPDVSAAAAAVDLYNQPLSLRAQDDRGVVEKDTGFYVQLGWDTEVAGMALRGNVGVRQVTTALESTGFTTIGSELEEVTVDRDYTDTLPSLNVVLSPVEDVNLRFSYSKVMARPGLGDLTPGGRVDQFNGVINYGNPNLDPFRADAFDLSAEWYYDEEALLAIAYFKKEIESFVTSTTESGVPWSATGLPESILDPNGQYGADDLWTVNGNGNGDGGDLDGFEIIWQQPLFGDFGVVANYTYVDSQVQYGEDGDGNPIIDDLQGLSRNTYNLTFYYETEKFGARISYAARDDYLTRVPGRNENDVEGTLGTQNVDMALNYNYSEQLKFTLEGINLTDEYNNQYVDSSIRTSVYHHTGRQFYLGASYAF